MSNAPEQAAPPGSSRANSPEHPLPVPMTFPASPGQERLWFLERMSPGSTAYNLPEVWRLKGELNVDALRRALHSLVQRHETLRTAIVEDSGKALQRICSSEAFALEVVESSPGSHLREADVARMLQSRIRTPFQLSCAPLIRATLFEIERSDHVLLLNLHHSIADEWSLGIVLKELGLLYESCARATPANLPELPIQYADFAVWQHQWIESPALQLSLKYWQEKLAAPPPPTCFPPDHIRSQSPGPSGATVFHHLPVSLAEQVRVYSRQHGVTAYVTLLAAFKCLLQRWTLQEDIVVGATFAGRDMPETEGLVGFFVNTHALRTDLSGDPVFSEVIRRVRETVLGAVANQAAPLDRVVKAVSMGRAPDHQPLFNVMFSLQPGATEHWSLGDLNCSRVEVENGAAKFDFSLLVTDTGTGMRLRCEFRSDLFKKETVARILNSYESLLSAAVNGDRNRLSALPMQTPSEEQQAICESAGPVAGCAEALCLHQLFEAQCRRTPDSEAVVDGPERLTYSELDDRADRIAARLIAEGVKPESAIGVCLDRSSHLVAGLLGVLKSGGGYVPMDPAYPRERLHFLLEDSQAGIVLTRRLYASLFPPAVRVLVIEEIEGHPTMTHRAGDAVPVQPGNLAYIIYTSGSTGKPKGVVIEHRNAVALMRWARQAYSDAELKAVLFSTSICFDLSVFEMFAPLSWGGKVVVAENALSLPELPAAAEVTLVNTVPSAMRELLRMRAVPASVCVVNLAGEPLDTSLVDQVYDSTATRKLHDLYGPTETTTYSTGALRQRGQRGTIGFPLTNERVYILDSGSRPVPSGVPGEICIAGAGVARGYWNRADLTAERFTADPFHPADRMYRTGDLGRRLSDGSLEFLGRRDQQVKIRGFRIEPGEIEDALKRQPGVHSAVVVAREYKPNDRRLVAYLAAANPAEAVVTQIRSALSRELPDFMVPSNFVVLPALPLNANGKVDRSALPDPTLATPESPQPHVAPRDQTEAVLAEIWQEVLGRNSFGVHDDFFQLGGHSLLATQVVSRVAGRLGVELPLPAVFDATTISALAEVVRCSPPAAKSPAAIPHRFTPGEIDDLLRRLDSLPESEVDELLRQAGTNGISQ